MSSHVQPVAPDNTALFTELTEAETATVQGGHYRYYYPCYHYVSYSYPSYGYNSYGYTSYGYGRQSSQGAVTVNISGRRNVVQVGRYY